jgi:hypothetical protein
MEIDSVYISEESKTDEKAETQSHGPEPQAVQGDDHSPVEDPGPQAVQADDHSQVEDLNDSPENQEVQK